MRLGAIDVGYLKIDMKDSFSAPLMKKLQQAGTRAAHDVAVQVAKDTEPFVPARTKSFANRTQVVDSLVIYPGPSARMLYNGKLMIDPDTESAWAQKGATKVVTGKDLDIKTDVHSQAQAHWFEASKAQNMEKWERVAERAIDHELGN